MINPHGTMPTVQIPKKKKTQTFEWDVFFRWAPRWSPQSGRRMKVRKNKNGENLSFQKVVTS